MVEAGKPAEALDKNPFPPIRHICVIFGIRLGYFLLKIKVEEMLDFLDGTFGSIFKKFSHTFKNNLNTFIFFLL